MSLLFRYLTKNNAMILLPTLAVGIGLYVLTDPVIAPRSNHGGIT